VLIIQQGVRVGGEPDGSTPDGKVTVTAEVELRSLWHAILYGRKQGRTSR